MPLNDIIRIYLLLFLYMKLGFISLKQRNVNVVNELMYLNYYFSRLCIMQLIRKKMLSLTDPNESVYSFIFTFI